MLWSWMFSELVNANDILSAASFVFCEHVQSFHNEGLEYSLLPF